MSDLVEAAERALRGHQDGCCQLCGGHRAALAFAAGEARALRLTRTRPAKERSSGQVILGRYCGLKNRHDAHEWQQIGRADGPTFRCRGKA